MKQILKWYLFGLFLGLITFSVSLTGCEKPIDDIVVPPTDEEGLVPVSLTLGFTEETGSYTPAPGSRSGLASKEAMPPSRRNSHLTPIHVFPHPCRMAYTIWK